MRLSALSFLTTYAIADRLQLRRQFYEDKAAVLLLQNWIYGDVIKSPIFRDMAVSLEVSSCPFYVNTVFQSVAYQKKARSYLRDIATIKRNSHIIINALSHHIA